MKTTLKKKAVAAGLVAGMTAGLGAGLLLEMSGTAGASDPAVEATADASADDTAGSRAERRAARLQEVLAPLVEAGTITQAQADAVIAALAEAAPEFEGRHGRHGRHGDHMGDRRGAGMIGVVVDTLGITFEDLRTAVAGGQTLAEIAAANGSSGEELIAALVERLEIRLADHVADGELTDAEAAERLADATARITEFVNDTPSLDEFGRHGR